ncbi:MAG: hypothetical protein R2764_09730 [Bacteroidales bacterium]
MPVIKACKILRYAAGNFYFNDKPSGTFVGQQPFGGQEHQERMINRVVISTCFIGLAQKRTVRNADPPLDYRYDYMKELLY